MQIGEKVRYTGCSDKQMRWGGSNKDPRGILKEGYVYIISDIEMHSFHTQVRFEGVNGNFNSVCFEPI